MAMSTYPHLSAPEKYTEKETHKVTDLALDDVFRGTDYQTLITPQFPAVPPPALQKYGYQTSEWRTVRAPYESVNTLTPDQIILDSSAAQSYKTSSASSSWALDTSTMTPISSNDLEKSSLRTKDSEIKYSSKKHRSSRDPEKGRHSPTYSSQGRTSHNHVDVDFIAARLPYANADEAAEQQYRVQEAHAVRILLFLSLPCVALSTLNAIWTLISLLITLLTQPVRLCARRPTFGQQLGGLVGPALNLHLRCIYTPLLPYADEDTAYKPAVLMLVQLLSPLLSFGLMIAAWVTAVFWVTSAMIGDPAGLDRRDDGRDTVLFLRKRWEQWLSRCIVEK